MRNEICYKEQGEKSLPEMWAKPEKLAPGMSQDSYFQVRYPPPSSPVRISSCSTDSHAFVVEQAILETLSRPPQQLQRISKQEQQDILSLMRVLSFKTRMHRTNAGNEAGQLAERRRLFIDYPFDMMAWYLQRFVPDEALFEAGLLSDFYHRLLILIGKVGVDLQAHSAQSPSWIQDFADSFAHVLVACLQLTPGAAAADNAIDTPFYQVTTNLLSSIDIFNGA
jgi:hypothetical protein